jgi:hypothetical protein
MSSYRVEVTPNEDRPGVQVWIVREDDDECVSLECAEGEGEFSDGSRIPAWMLFKAREISNRIN